MAHRFERVTLRRTLCYGHCPVYKVTVSSTGEVEYSGEWFVAREGVHRWQISPQRVRLLAEAFERAGYRALRDEYTRAEMTDAPSCLTSIEYEDGSSKSVDHYHGDSSAPAELTRLEDRIDAIVGTHSYIRIRATNPSTFLLTWNPSKHFRWENLQTEIEEVESGFHQGTSWSCGVTRRIVEGDRVFLMRLGDEPRGMVGSGRVERYDLSGAARRVYPGSAVYEAPYREDQSDQARHTRKTALYVDVRWEALLDPGLGTLPLSWLEGLNEGLPREKRQIWTPQNSGITVREGVVAALEAGWAEFLASREIPQ
jgi:Domain of unknown function (DUF6438)